jgi:hypothetical protein
LFTSICVNPLLDLVFGLDTGRSNVGETAFWRNYFHHCEKARKEYLERSLKQQSQEIIVGSGPCYLESKNDEPGHQGNEDFKQSRLPPQDVNLSQLPAGNIDDALDDSSLIPASVTDDSSYVNVIPSAPNSLNTFMTTRSLEDLVLIDLEGQENT